MVLFYVEGSVGYIHVSVDLNPRHGSDFITFICGPKSDKQRSALKTLTLKPITVGLCPPCATGAVLVSLGTAPQGLWGFYCGVWHQNDGGRSLQCCALWVGASMGRTCLSGGSLCTRSIWDLGSLEVWVLFVCSAWLWCAGCPGAFHSWPALTFFLQFYNCEVNVNRYNYKRECCALVGYD